MLNRVVVVLLVTIIVMAGTVKASTGSSPLEPKPDEFKDVPGCYISTLHKVVPLGKDETSSDCVLFRCEDNWFDFYTCDITMAAPNCRTVSGPDTSKPYPDCCPILECTD